MRRQNVQNWIALKAKKGEKICSVLQEKIGKGGAFHE
jgi:hypothetical protein